MTDDLDTQTLIHRHAFLLGRRWDLTGHTSLHLATLLLAKPSLRVTSGRRTAQRNKLVGGAPRSYHLRGRAVDLAGSLSDLLDAHALVRRQRIASWCTGPEEVLLEYAGTRRQHLHVAW